MVAMEMRDQDQVDAVAGNDRAASTSAATTRRNRSGN
jgi:hypothetical protein